MAFLASGAILFLVHRAPALSLIRYSPRGSETIEWLAAGSELVVRARITAVEGGNHGQYEVIDADIIETLKGMPPARGVRFWGRDTYVSLPSDGSDEVLLFLVADRPPEAHGDTAWSVRSSRGWRSIVHLGEERLKKTSAFWNPVDMEMHVLTRPAEVLAAARKACGAGFGSGEAELELYSGAWQQPLMVEHWARLDAIMVPLGPAPGELAVRWAASPRVELRWLAVQLLGQLTDRDAPERVNALRALLNDPAYVSSGSGPWAVRNYLIRERAYEILAKKGWTLPPLIVEGTLHAYAPIQWGHIAVALAVVVAVFVARRLYQRRAFATTASDGGIGFGFTVALLLAIAIGHAWWKSRTRTDEIVLTAGARHRLASCDGGAQYCIIPKWPEGKGLVGFSFLNQKALRDAWAWDSDASSNRFSRGGSATYGYGSSFYVVAPNVPGRPWVEARTVNSTWQRFGLAAAKGQVTGPDGVARSYRMVRITYPWLFALPACVIVISLNSRLRRRRRIAGGFCGRCGYDLRASSGRCPECGTAMPG